jgi:hypothetical protein
MDFVDEMSQCRAQFRTFHHRALDAGAVLGIVKTQATLCFLRLHV